MLQTRLMPRSAYSCMVLAAVSGLVQITERRRGLDALLTEFAVGDSEGLLTKFRERPEAALPGLRPRAPPGRLRVARPSESAGADYRSQDELRREGSLRLSRRCLLRSVHPAGRTARTFGACRCGLWPGALRSLDTTDRCLAEPSCNRNQQSRQSHPRIGGDVDARFRRCF